MPGTPRRPDIPVPPWLVDLLRKQDRRCPYCAEPAPSGRFLKVSFRLGPVVPDLDRGPCNLDLAVRCGDCRRRFVVRIAFRRALKWRRLFKDFAKGPSARREESAPVRIEPSVPADRRDRDPISDAERDRIVAALRRTRSPRGLLRVLGIGG